jgi:hypothetical protein
LLPYPRFQCTTGGCRFYSSFSEITKSYFLADHTGWNENFQTFYPRLSGLAQLFPALVLLLKGYQIVGLQPMDLPSNWISIHPGLRQKVVDSIFQRCEKITKRFAEKILSGRKFIKA